MSFFENETFEKLNSLKPGEYEGCIFDNCDFGNSDLAEIIFDACEFTGCNLTSARITASAFRNCTFKESKLLGLRFDTCNPFRFSAKFENCNLDHAYFYKLPMRETKFKDCSLREVDFTECNLTGSVFDACDLAGTIFEQTVLEKADLRTARNFLIDPELNRIKKARFSVSNLAGLLGKYDIRID